MGEGANENAFLIIMTARIVCLRYKIERKYLVLQYNYYYSLNILFYTLIDHLYLLINLPTELESSFTDHFVPPFHLLVADL